ncbi:hypothetical protein PM082_008196 [Marasmius tenuissimus]|nr:hypothetical protein PM082_008196 [Marasmius tenuissimus]
MDRFADPPSGSEIRQAVKASSGVWERWIITTDSNYVWRDCHNIQISHGVAFEMWHATRRSLARRHSWHRIAPRIEVELQKNNMGTSGRRIEMQGTTGPCGTPLRRLAFLSDFLTPLHPTNP